MNYNATEKEVMPTNGRECVSAAPMDTLTELMDEEMALLDKTTEELLKLMEKLGC